MKRCFINCIFDMFIFRSLQDTCTRNCMFINFALKTIEVSKTSKYQLASQTNIETSARSTLLEAVKNNYQFTWLSFLVF